MTNLDADVLRKVIKKSIADVLCSEIPIGISNRHIHLSEKDFKTLFSLDDLEVQKYLKQPGEFASKQTVTLKGPKGTIERVRILGPLRKRTQVEISKTDARMLGIDAPIRLSGNLDDAAEITLISEKAELTTAAAIVAQRHIHLSYQQMAAMGLKKEDVVSVKVETPHRSMIFEEVFLRPGENFVLEMHLDTDEANAGNVSADTVGKIICHK